MAIDARELEKGLSLYDQVPLPAKKPFELDQPRTEGEIAALRQKIVTIAQVFSTNARIRVLPTLTDDEPWSCSLGEDALRYLEEYVGRERTTLEDLPAEVFQPKTIYYTRNSLANHTLEEILRVVRHEIGHVNHTDFRFLLEGQRLVQSEGYLPLSWVNISNPLEDAYVNNQEMGRSETVREQMEAGYFARLPDLEEQIPQLPINLQLGKNILYYWFTKGKNCPTITDQRILATFEQIKPAVDQIIRSSSAAEVYQIIKEKIWPVYRLLEEQAQKDTEKQELLNQLLGQNAQAGKSGGQQGEGAQGKPGGMQQSQSGGLLEKIKQILGGRRQASSSQASAPTSSSGLSEQLKQEVGQDLQHRLAQAGSRQEQLPSELRQELEQALNALPQPLRQQITEAAKQALEQQALHELEQEGGMKITKAEKNQQTGRMELRLNTVTKKEAQETDKQMQQLEAEEQQAQENESQERERQAEEQRQRLAEELAKQRELREMKAAGFEEREEKDYSRFRELENSVKPRLPSFIRKLLPVLPKSWQAEFEGHFYTGKKTDFKVLGKKIPVGDYRVQLRKDLHPTEEPRIYVELLIDNSGTMSGTKMDEAIKTCIFFARSLKTIGVPFAIKLLGERVTAIINLGQDYDDIKLKIKPRLIQLTTASEGATDIGSPIEAAYQEMLKARRLYADSQGMIFLITDGRANRGLVGEALKQKADEVKKAFPIFVFLLENRTNPSFLAEMEGIFGAGFVTMTTQFTELLPSAEGILIRQMSRLLPRWQT